MRPFDYVAPKTVEEAVRLLADGAGTALPLAGGTDLISLMKDDIARPSRLVSLRAVDELRGVAESSGTLRIGATTTLDELVETPGFGDRFPALREAVDGIRSPQLRAMGTVVGELLQRPRCWYYRLGFGLLAMRDGRSMVEDGDNRHHAILGTQGPAYFVHPSSLAPGLIALGARVEIASTDGRREVPVDALFQVPGSGDESESTLVPGELVTAVLLPTEAIVNATYEVRQKQALDWPLATASVALQLRGATVVEARVVLGHVAPTPWRSRAAEQRLEGRPLDDSAAAEAGENAVAEARPLSGNGYKVQLASVAVKRALLRAAKREV